MGRNQDLERLALGRSAFNDVQADDLNEVGDSTTFSTGPENPGSQSYKQQYDGKGRPTNPATEARNQTMRNAQNAVLALVGVVESKDIAHMEYRYLEEARAEMVKSAQRVHGPDLDLVTSLVHVSLNWRPDSLISRVQAGTCASSMNLIDIVFGDLSKSLDRSTRVFLEDLFAGAPVSILYAGLKILLCWALEQGVGRLQSWLGRRLQKKTLNRVNRVLVFAFEVMVVAIDVVLLPWQYYATTQKLGLAPARPLLPSWTVLLPWSPFSMHNFIWKPTLDVIFGGIFLSPAVLLLLKNSLNYDPERFLAIDNETSATPCSPLKGHGSLLARLGLHQAPFGKLLNQCYNLRSGVLRWFGFNVVYVDEPEFGESSYEDHHTLPPMSAPNQGPGQSSISKGNERLRRGPHSTLLSHGPIAYLADRIDNMFTRLLMWPLKSIVLRAVAQSFLTSTLPKTTHAIAAAPQVFAPFGGGPLRILRDLGFSVTAWQGIAIYLNKVGLSLALKCSAEIGVFFVVYKLTQW